MNLSKNTELIISSNKPDVIITTNLALRGIWQRLRFAWMSLFSNIEITSSYNFREDDDIDNIIEILKEKTEERAFRVMKSLPEAIMPTKTHKSDTGWDLYLPSEFRLNPGETRRVDFGIIVDIEPGYEIQVRNRSSVVWRYNTMMAIGVGSIDCDYRGSIYAPFFNFGTEQVIFQRGDRLAQMVIKKTENIGLKEGKVNLNTKRGDGGYGSSGK